MRIGILGGTFNPVHNGHLYIAKQALKKLGLDKVIFIPAYIPPHKKLRGNVKSRDRVRMLRLAVTGEKRFALSEYEIRQKGASYSIKTARFLRRKFGKAARLFFLVGADSAKGLGRWKKSAALLKLLQFVVFPRPGFKQPAAPKLVMTIKMRGIDVSSTKIRNLIKAKKPIHHLVPRKVRSYITTNHLYTN